MDTVNLRDLVDDRLDAFNDLFLACSENHAPVGTVKVRHKPNPFIKEDIRDLMKERDYLHQRARKTGTKEYWRALRELRNRVKVALRELQREYHNQEIRKNKNNGGAIWKTIRSAPPNKTGRASFTKDKGTLASDFNHFFMSVGDKAARDFAELARSHGLSNLSSPFNFCPSQTHDKLFEFKAVSSEDVQKVIMAIPSNKAPGHDRIPLFVINDYLPQVLPTLTGQVNLSFASSAFPRAWKKSEVVPGAS